MHLILSKKDQDKWLIFSDMQTTALAPFDMVDEQGQIAIWVAFLAKIDT
jgi:hypothetical protein